MVAPKTEPASTPAGKPSTIDEYIAGYPDEVRGMLQRVRTAISDQVPGFSEKIRYGMPAIMLGSTNDPTGGRYALHFAAWKNHLGLYPIPTLPEPLESEIAPYREAKDSVNFPYTRPVPYDLISRVTAAIVSLRHGN